MSDKKISLQLRYLVIIGVFLILSTLILQNKPNFCHLSSENQQWIRDLFLNLGSGIIGSWLVIYLYDLILLKQQTADKEHRQKMGLYQVGQILDEHIRFLYGMYVAISPSTNSEINSLDDIFDNTFFENIQDLNLCKIANRSSVIPWHQAIDNHNRLLRTKALEVTVQFGFFLDSTIFGYLNFITKSPFANEEWSNTIAYDFSMFEKFSDHHAQDFGLNCIHTRTMRRFAKSLNIHIQCIKELFNAYNQHPFNSYTINLAELSSTTFVEPGSGSIER